MDLSVDESAERPPEGAVATIRNSAAILGDISWLMMESPWHRGRIVADFVRLSLPPIKHRQFRLFYNGKIPIAFISWALLSPEAERRYLDDPYSLQPEDWTSGKAIYLVDCVAARNTMRKIAPYLRQDPLIAVGPVRSVKARNGKRILVEYFVDAAGRHVKAGVIAH
jgi:cytolysin-activating lysine-acyltransferase